MASLPQGVLHGAAHITGGGLLDNLPRVLPEGCRASIDKGSWKVPTIFNIIQNAADIPDDEMFQVFNMGIGMTLVVPAKRAEEALKLTKGILIGKRGFRIGEIGTGARKIIELELGARVHLDLQVKLKRKWRRDVDMLDRLGIE